MKRCSRLAAVICLCALGLTGCKEADVPGVSTVYVSRKGQISACFVEDFTEDYYSLAELTEMAVTEAAEYNAATQGKKAAVKLEKVELLPDDSSKIMVSYRFDGWESYTVFNQETLFYGTVGEAVAEGFGVDVILKSVADGSLYAGDQLGRATDRYVIITDVKADICCPGKVTHISEDATVNEDGSVDTSGTKGVVYILMK